MRSIKQSLLFVFTLLWISISAQNAVHKPQWPSVKRETRPWTRWWWHGSAVTKEGITHEMEAYKKAGLGGLEITPIYGVYGAEKQFVNYLSPQWMELLRHTLQEAERLDMGIDMATGTGWPFGGPWVSADDACKNMEYKTYTLKGGERLSDKVYFIQQPYLRAVGNQIYEVHDGTIAGEQAKGTLKEPLLVNKGQVDIKQLVEPISANKNLQALALDQVKFEKPLPLQTLMGYSEDGKVVELTSKMDKDGSLQWTAPEGNWKLYAVFSGWHGKMVERAGPGGEGNVIDHFSAYALKNYLQYFDDAFKGQDLKSLRAFFNDSYEVDDARGVADFTPALFEEFKKRRGYDLKENFPALFGQDSEEKNNRVLCDFRETISEMVLDNFTRQWKAWAHANNAVVRNQAHGSPANILDLYATVDIPEIEGVEPLRIKMASSAGNVTGKALVSSESATWLNEHFESSLSDIKTALDRFMLHGVNHIFYHGTTYSPPGEAWPGRLFYAAVHLNPRNSLWPHFSGLNKYVERSQSLLQVSKPDNDVLLYYPIYDRFSTRGAEMIEHFDGVGSQFDNTVFKQAAEMMLSKGYAYDYISDQQITRTKTESAVLVTEGNSRYQTLVLPHCKFIPHTTLTKILLVVEEGGVVIMPGGPPSNISGYHNQDKKTLSDLVAKVAVAPEVDGIKNVELGKGKIFIGNDLNDLLIHAGIRRESMVGAGIQFLRKTLSDNKTLYFVANGEVPYEGWISLQVQGQAASIYNPMTGEIGTSQLKTSTKTTDVFLKLTPGETLFIEVLKEKAGSPAPLFLKAVGEPLQLTGPWSIRFTAGGPQLPPPVQLNTLMPWTSLDNKLCESFSGTATYSLSFPKPKQKSGRWLLDLGTVDESAEVILNGQSLGIVLGPKYQLYIDDSMFKEKNDLQVKVCNLMANRISDMDKKGIFWKKFYNVNFPSRKAENRKNGLFDASHWTPKTSGLTGPVLLFGTVP
ncbi:MAG TPA: glycosyl hydrolase, partial [Chryseolinea sp.]|nr:glycosyl hydrolase [Chryseolinea sp.]